MMRDCWPRSGFPKGPDRREEFLATPSAFLFDLVVEVHGETFPTNLVNKLGGLGCKTIEQLGLAPSNDQV